MKPQGQRTLYDLKSFSTGTNTAMNHAKLLHYWSHRGAEITLYEVLNLLYTPERVKSSFQRRTPEVT